MRKVVESLMCERRKSDKFRERKRQKIYILKEMSI